MFKKIPQKYSVFLEILLLAWVYFAAGEASFLVNVSHKIVTPVFFVAEGFALAAVILRGYQLVPGIILGQLALALANGLGWFPSFSIACVNGLEAMIGAFLFHRWRVDVSLNSVKDQLKLTLLIFFVLQPFSASLGTFILLKSGLIHSLFDYFVTWQNWWLGNSMGQFLVVPILLVLARSSNKTFIRTHQTILPLLLLLVAFFLVFGTATFGRVAIAQAIFIPLLLWIALSGEMVIVSLACSGLTVLAIYATANDFGPFAGENVNQITDMNMFVIGISLTSQFFCALFAERKLAEANLRIAAATFETQDGIIVTSPTGDIVTINHSFTRITGYQEDFLKGQNFWQLSVPQEGLEALTHIRTVLSQLGSWEGERVNQRFNGELYYESLTVHSVKDEANRITHYVFVIRDISESKAAADEIKSLAFYDVLTNLPNRRLLIDRLKQALTASSRSGRSGALLFIDLDNFKSINDYLGHDMGDLLLKQVALRLSDCVRIGDTVARLGGDEFVVMLEDLSTQPFEAAAQTEAVGEKILEMLSQPYLLEAGEYHSTASVGGTLFSNGKASTDELLKQADIAMYQAKKAGRNAIRFFDPQMQAIITARVMLESELHKAIEHHQFALFYQVQMDGQGKALGAEALIRWNHPESGLISPAVFIPLAEEIGVILQIGDWVIETACEQIKAWQSHPVARDLQLAINVSALQFRQPNFVTQIENALSRTGINPAKLKLELTESLVLENVEDTINKMNLLRQLEVRFSMDDFGTGHSSLSNLKKLPLDQLKIDQSFVRDISTDQDDAVIVQTIIAMAKNLGMEVIAEGVETQDQFEFLKQHGCEAFQGYLFSKPVPLEQFEALLLSEPSTG